MADLTDRDANHCAISTSRKKWQKKTRITLAERHVSSMLGCCELLVVLWSSWNDKIYFYFASGSKFVFSQSRYMAMMFAVSLNQSKHCRSIAGHYNLFTINCLRYHHMKPTNAVVYYHTSKKLSNTDHITSALTKQLSRLTNQAVPLQLPRRRYSEHTDWPQ